jgi:CubicO group peptidase (beta-lactamase class C family)
LVFDKLGMRSSTFDQPLPHALDSLAASGTLADGTPVPGRWHVSPEMAAAGLWTTPTDLAKLAIGLARAAQPDTAGQVLPRALAEDMLGPHATAGVINILGTPEDPDAMGYGFFVGRKRPRFGHIGGHVGYQATLVFFADTGDGAVIMTNANAGLRVGNQLLDAIAKQLHWNWVVPPPP